MESGQCLIVGQAAVGFRLQGLDPTAIRVCGALRRQAEQRILRPPGFPSPAKLLGHLSVNYTSGDDGI